MVCAAQICRFLRAALTAGALCLPALAATAVYLEVGDNDEALELHMGTPLPPEQGVQGVCNALGELVAAGVLPTLAKAASLPIVHSRSCTCRLWTSSKACPLLYMQLSLSSGYACRRWCCAHASMTLSLAGWEGEGPAKAPPMWWWLACAATRTAGTVSSVAVACGSPSMAAISATPRRWRSTAWNWSPANAALK